MTSQVFDPARIEKISRIMPQFSKVAAKGDEVLLGLQGDPAFPFSNKNRPSAIIEEVRQSKNGTMVDLRLDDGSRKSINEFTIAPGDVWEFSDKGFEKVMDRERAQYRSEAALNEKKIEKVDYRGVEDLREQVAALRSELQAERQLTRNFHNTYIATLHELANDVCSLDSKGDGAQFCRTFNSEFTKMQSRAEDGLYRGVTDDGKEGGEEEDDEEEGEEGESVESLSDAEEEQNGVSDYF